MFDINIIPIHNFRCTHCALFLFVMHFSTYICTCTFSRNFPTKLEYLRFYYVIVWKGFTHTFTNYFILLLVYST